MRRKIIVLLLIFKQEKNNLVPIVVDFAIKMKYSVDLVQDLVDSVGNVTNENNKNIPTTTYGIIFSVPITFLGMQTRQI